ncbi:MAG: class I SAM-dependent methyltransferase [Ilumatobacteraceae bacterium]
MDDPLVRFYTKEYDEAQRLVISPHGRLELRTRQILRRKLPPAPATILDVGGGPGVHATWLVEQGYAVKLVDVIERHIEEARDDGLHAELGDAVDLDDPDDEFNAVLVLGPLYHLPKAVDRATALAEAKRVVKPGGPVVVAAISRFAGLLDLGTNGPWDDETADKLEPVLSTGEHDPSLGFTQAYFHRPDELRTEMEAAGFVDVEVLAVEGPLGHAVDHAPDPGEAIARAVEVVSLTEDEPALLAASPHLIAVGWRP